MAEKKPFPESREELLVIDSPYTEYDIEGVPWEDVVRRLVGESAIDAYCPACERKTVFRLSTPSHQIKERAEELKHKTVIVVEASCTRDWPGSSSLRCKGRLISVFLHDFDVLIKIGQYPSKADADQATLDPAINAELDKPLRRELGRAVGLRAHGIGIGSFVYLRRILESLIAEAHVTASKLPEWDDQLYQRSRVSERIEQLRDHLPSRLVRNARLYGILSKGVHELHEQECLDNFDLVFEAIAMILKERHEDKVYDRIVHDVEVAATKLTTRAKTPP
jgi:hypothetical protein